MHTYGAALALVGVVVPDHLSAQTEVPVLTGPQAQGDLPVAGSAQSCLRPSSQACRRRPVLGSAAFSATRANWKKTSSRSSGAPTKAA